MTTSLQHVDGRPPRCHACGFDLTGLPSVEGAAVRCPECGAEVRMELAYSSDRERLAEWLREPAEPSPARFATTTAVMIIVGMVALAVLVATLYIGWVIVSHAFGP